MAGCTEDHRCRGGSAAADDAEVKDLASFIDGSIQIPEIRHHLWRSWGFCERHTWLHAVVECELRRRPFGTTILYEDLTSRAAAALGRPHSSDARRRRALRARDTCFTCTYVALAEPDPVVRPKTRRVNRRRRFSRLVAGTRATWEPRSCPSCLGGAGPSCRPHLLDGAGSLDGVAEQLGVIADRLRRSIRAMASGTPDPDPAVATAWIETLGWFAGWGYPAAVPREAAQEPAGRPAR